MCISMSEIKCAFIRKSMKISKIGFSIRLGSDRGGQLAVGIVGDSSTSGNSQKSCCGEIGRKALQDPHFNLCIH